MTRTSLTAFCLAFAAWTTVAGTFYVDSRDGDDSRDGTSPAAAWKTFRNVNGKVLGPGERLLLRRGGVFNGELRLSAKGKPGSWAEIGAYGEGMNPQIRRNRHINERCVSLDNPEYLAFRDIVVCNAGQGIMVQCNREGGGHLLLERCVAHHIEGSYIFNSHGIPEWHGEKGTRVVKAWTFARNLDTEGWSAENTGCKYVFHYQKPADGPGSYVRSYRSYPVRTAYGGYYVVAARDSAEARIVTPEEVALGLSFGAAGCNAVCIKMQNGTDSRRMRLWWQGDMKDLEWKQENSCTFDVKPKDVDDAVYTIEMPQAGAVRRLRIDFSADGEPVTGTCRIDYIWAGRLSP